MSVVSTGLVTRWHTGRTISVMSPKWCDVARSGFAFICEGVLLGWVKERTMGHWADQHVKPAIQYRERPAPKPKRRAWPVVIVLLLAGTGGAGWHYRSELMPAPTSANEPVSEASAAPAEVAKQPHMRPASAPAPTASDPLKVSTAPTEALPTNDPKPIAAPAKPEPDLRAIETLERRRAEHERLAVGLEDKVDEAATKRYPYQGQQLTYLEIQRRIHAEAIAAGDSSTAWKATQAANAFNAKLQEWTTKAKHERETMAVIERQIARERVTIRK